MKDEVWRQFFEDERYSKVFLPVIDGVRLLSKPGSKIPALEDPKEWYVDKLPVQDDLPEG